MHPVNHFKNACLALSCNLYPRRVISFEGPAEFVHSSRTTAIFLDHHHTLLAQKVTNPRGRMVTVRVKAFHDMLPESWAPFSNYDQILNDSVVFIVIQ